MSLTKPVSAEQPCGPDPEYDPEYLLLFSRAAPQAEAQYGDFVSTPEAVNWPEIERDARRLLTRSKDIRVLILLLRSRIQQAGAQGLAEILTQLAELSVIWSDALHPQLLTGEGASAESIEDAALARSNALAALLDHEGVMADIRGITLSNSAVLRLQVRDVERALSAPRRLMRWPPNPSASNWPTSKPVGHYRWRRFAKRRKAQNACKCGRVRH
ncbi:Component of the type VI protein secretion system [Salmonella enterica subsp. enterica serovar Heidelberg str. 90-0318]|nr:Component of the type VI protein secretion system [Salmonella enterica subsp. enterica serovar Heidelberg str. 90-0318]